LWPEFTMVTVRDEFTMVTVREEAPERHAIEPRV
jgi:hypothetical protein